MYWKHKYPPLTVFMDKRSRDLVIPPDVIGAWEACPFREGVFNTVLFDPPHNVRSGGYDPRFAMHRKYGTWASKTEAVIAIAKAQEEFASLAPRLCFKWCNTRDGPTLWVLLPLFEFWKEIYRRMEKTKGQGNVRGRTFWVTFKRRDPQTAPSI